MVFFGVGAVLSLFAAGQLFWLRHAVRLGKRWIQEPRRRVAAAAVVAAIYLFLLLFNMFGRDRTPVEGGLREILLVAPWQWWIASSTVAFLLAVILKVVRLATGGVAKILDVPEAPARREFLGSVARVAVAAPFAAGAYGMLYGRLNLELTQRRVHLPRLPAAFDGLRIAQLSDIHIGPFMPEEQIRRYVEIVNGLKADLIVLTGDYITWDPETQFPVVNALSGLRAPLGVFGCLGNHDAWSGVEASITELFREARVRILRRERHEIARGGDRLNLIGVDYETRRSAPVTGEQHVVRRYLEGVERLMAADTANILLSHNPDTFDRAAELGIDLSLSGHTHGGQVSLEFISPQIAPCRIATPYVTGWFQKAGGRLYVNRGIGTIGPPIRLGAPPEITQFELVRRA